MVRLRSRQSETESVVPRMLRRGAVKRQHISRWAVGERELAPGVVGGTHLHPSTHEVIREIVNDGSSAAGQVLTLAVTGALLASGGDYVAFDTIVDQTGFAGVTAAGDSWTHPVAAVYVLEYEHTWDGHDRGGRIELEVDGEIPAGGIIAQGNVGRRGRGTIIYEATAGSIGKVKVTQVSGGEEYANAVLRVGLSDLTTTVAATSPWAKLFAADAWGVTFDGTYWWTTDGDTLVVSKRTADGSVVSTFTAAEVGGVDGRARGIAFDGSDLWVMGDQEIAGRYSTAGAFEDDIDLAVTWAAETTGTGVAFDGADLWFVGRATKELRRYSVAGALELTVSLADLTTPQGAAYFDGRIFVVDGGAGQLVAFSLAGAQVDVIGLSGAPFASAYDVWIDDDGTLYVSQNGDGLYRRVGVVT